MPNLSWDELSKIKHGMAQDLANLKLMVNIFRTRIEKIDEIILNHEKEEG